VQEASDVFLEVYREEFPEDTDELFEPKTPANAIEALVKYVAKYPRDLEEFKVLYTEISGTVPIRRDKVLHFRMDSILEELNDNRGKFSFEHKTKGGYFNSQWENQWVLSEQNGVYHHVLYCLFPPEEVVGVRINGASFAKTKSGCTINFTRVPIYKSKDSMRVWYWNSLYWVSQIEEEFQRLEECKDSDEVMMAFPMNSQGCTKYFGCPYHDFCIAWPNPLRRCDHPPLGFKEEFWDPRKLTSTHQMDLDQAYALLERGESGRSLDTTRGGDPH